MRPNIANAACLSIGKAKSRKIDRCRCDFATRSRVDYIHSQLARRLRLDPYLHLWHSCVVRRILILAFLVVPAQFAPRHDRFKSMRVRRKLCNPASRMACPVLVDSNGLCICDERNDRSERCGISKVQSKDERRTDNTPRAEVRTRPSEGSSDYATDLHHIWIGPTRGDGEGCAHVLKLDSSLQIVEPRRQATVDVPTSAVVIERAPRGSWA
mmetsp:Transcript_43739/g.72697  ORF Transcript_43739/g.72697 Transcript_43739/m.72697 type:complete len:212 (-) Transcript_43739:435-1070(-)